IPEGAEVETRTEGLREYARIPSGATIVYTNDAKVVRGEEFTISRAAKDPAEPAQLRFEGQREFKLPAGVTHLGHGSSWGTFTIACTIPIALFIGLYMYKLRKGAVVEASAIGALAVLAATVAGNWIPGSGLEQYFSLSREATIWAICLYGFVASVL